MNPGKTIRVALGFARGFVAAAITHPALAAEPPVYTGPQIVVTGTRIPQKLSDTLQSTTVITADDIARSGQSTLVELLQTLGGVEITSNGGAGQPSAVFIRGANSAHTLVLVDGMRLGSATSGTTAFEHIPLDRIERIEIVAGPLSSVYGSDAIGGVVQIFTKNRRSSRGLSVTAGTGSYRHRTLDASFASSVADTDFNIAAGYSDSAGFDATKASIPFGQHNPDRDGYRNTNVSARVVHHLDTDNDFGGTLFRSEGNTHFDSGPSDDVNHQTLSAWSIYSQNQFAPAWQSLVRLGNGHDQIVTTGSFPAKFQTDQDQATWQNTFKLGPGALVVGAAYLRQRVDSSTDFTTKSRKIASVFAGFGGDYGNHGVQVNLRNDDNSQFGNHTTGSLGYGYRITERLRARATVGTAFHAPTFNDLYFPFFGNPDLKAERSKSGDAGLDYQVGGQRFSVSWFEMRITDLIVFDLNTFLPQNIAEAKIHGTEWSYQGTLLGTQLRAKLTLQDPKDKTTGFQLQRRAKQFGSLGASRAFGAWNAGAELTASGKRFDSANEDPATRSGGYALVNLFAGYAISPAWSLDLRWNNIADRKYELVRHYNTPGSNVFVTVRWTPAL